jgi:hypothetical protein
VTDAVLKKIPVALVPLFSRDAARQQQQKPGAGADHTKTTEAGNRPWLHEAPPPPIPHCQHPIDWVDSWDGSVFRFCELR